MPLVALLGNVWSVLGPWRAAADLVAWLWRRTGGSWSVRPYPEELGRWPAAILLLAFAALELAYADAANPRALAVGTLLYSVATWTGMLVYGRRAWLENGDGFSVYFGLLARISPFAARERDGRREIVARAPFAGFAVRERRPGTVAFVSVMLGSVAFDGFSRTTFWQDRLYRLEAPLVIDQPGLADLLTTLLNLAGLITAITVVALAYLAAVEVAQRIARRDVSLSGVFVGSLVPIALVYAVAHYFSLFVLQGQFAITLASDPFGRG